MAVEILTVSTPDDIAIVECLAREIWAEHFTPIIGAAQVEYMLEKFQSAEAMKSQISSGWEYYLAMIDNNPVGYAGLVPEVKKKRMMLSKLYVKSPARGKGVGKSILEFIERKCELEEFSSLWLTVNRFNTGPISWYERHGFETIDEVKKDIGGGYFMDDYIMEKSIKIKPT
jgi:GNAT superfamily N-acetyltransferase